HIRQLRTPLHRARPEERRQVPEKRSRRQDREYEGVGVQPLARDDAHEREDRAGVDPRQVAREPITPVSLPRVPRNVTARKHSYSSTRRTESASITRRISSMSGSGTGSSRLKTIS